MRMALTCGVVVLTSSLVASNGLGASPGLRQSGTGPASINTGQAPKTHRLEATPETVAYGYYWSEAKPALRIASGDIIDVDTLLTSTPQSLTRAGLADERVQASLKAIVAAFPNGYPNRGPGGHILTGP